MVLLGNRVEIIYCMRNRRFLSIQSHRVILSNISAGVVEEDTTCMYNVLSKKLAKNQYNLIQ